MVKFAMTTDIKYIRYIKLDISIINYTDQSM